MSEQTGRRRVLRFPEGAYREITDGALIAPPDVRSMFTSRNAADLEPEFRVSTVPCPYCRELLWVTTPTHMTRVICELPGGPPLETRKRGICDTPVMVKDVPRGWRYLTCRPCMAQFTLPPAAETGREA